MNRGIAIFNRRIRKTTKLEERRKKKKDRIPNLKQENFTKSLAIEDNFSEEKRKNEIKKDMPSPALLKKNKKS